MSRTTITTILAVLLIALSGIVAQKVILDNRWAEDVIYFDIESESLVHGKMETTVHPTLKGWSWDRDSFVATNVSRRVTNYRSYDHKTEQPLKVESIREGPYIRYRIFFPDTKYTDYTYVSEFDLEYIESMEITEKLGIFSWNWGSPEFSLPQRIYVTLPEGSEMGQINGVPYYEKRVENGRVVVFFENAPEPHEYFRWDVCYTLP
ncbi:MAG: hypothetical protein JXA98_05005 [Methanosarcinaceae archaeon]|nr:hypothetical protein [Methanosarcinaceae archaeon]